MTKKKQLMILSGALVVILAVFSVVSVWSSREEDEEEEDRIEAVSIDRNGETVYKCSDDEDETLKDYGTDLSCIYFDTCAAYSADEEDLLKYGLDEESRKTFTVKYKSSGKKQTVTFYLSDKMTDEDGEALYIQMKDSDMIYRLDAGDFEKIS